VYNNLHKIDLMCKMAHHQKMLVFGFVTGRDEKGDQFLNMLSTMRSSKKYPICLCEIQNLESSFFVKQK